MPTLVWFAHLFSLIAFSHSMLFGTGMGCMTDCFVFLIGVCTAPSTMGPTIQIQNNRTPQAPEEEGAE